MKGQVRELPFWLKPHWFSYRCLSTSIGRIHLVLILTYGLPNTLIPTLGLVLTLSTLETGHKDPSHARGLLCFRTLKLIQRA